MEIAESIPPRMEIILGGFFLVGETLILSKHANWRGIATNSEIMADFGEGISKPSLVFLKVFDYNKVKEGQR